MEPCNASREAAECDSPARKCREECEQSASPEGTARVLALNLLCCELRRQKIPGFSPCFASADPITCAAFVTASVEPGLPVTKPANTRVRNRTLSL